MSEQQTKVSCTFCNGTGKLGFQQEDCWFCLGEGYLESHLVKGEVE